MSVTIETIFASVICQIDNHNPIRINENSLICATVNHTIILFFFLYHKNHIKTITINGFQIRTNTEKIMIGIRNEFMLPNDSWDHKNTKNTIIKKSLNGLILLLISYLYGNDAKVNHAINAQISSENQIISIHAAKIRHHQIAKISKNSVDFAIEDNKRGRIYFVIR